MTLSDDTKTPASSGVTTPSKSRGFYLGMELTYRDRKKNSVAVFYYGSSAYGLAHIIRLEDGSRFHIHYINLQLIDQPDFSKFHKNSPGI